MENVPPNDHNIDAPAIVPAPEEEEDPEEDSKEDPEEDLEEDPEEDLKGDDDDVMEMDDEAKVIDPYMDDGWNNPPPPNSKDEETPPNSPVIPKADAAIRFEKERVQNEANHAEGPNVAPVARECTFADFMKCSPITFCGNEGAVGLIIWIEKTKMVATLGIEAVTRKTWAEMKVMMTEEFCPPKEIQGWNMAVGESGWRQRRLKEDGGEWDDDRLLGYIGLEEDDHGGLLVYMSTYAFQEVMAGGIKEPQR
nr:hypothetical protein [Tanacetum cinerariifolium]